jgi:molybdopterin molybdotransferase
MTATTLDPNAQQDLSVTQALARILTQVERLPPRPTLKKPLFEALDRVLAETLISPLDVPPHDNSAMDGYALDGKQLDGDGPLRFRIMGKAFAGEPWNGPIGTGQCLQITTGAVMPVGLDTVVPKEMVKVDNEEGAILVAPHTVRRGDNRRLQGEDLRQGHPALEKGQLLTPAALGLIASLGIGEVKVFDRPKVAMFSTGDEILSIGETPRTGAVYDSNRYTVMGMLRRMGCEVIDLGAIPDEPVHLKETFIRASTQADVIITSGGVSVGEADHTKAIMAELGGHPQTPEAGVDFWRIAMRPGRPMAFGSIARQALNGAVLDPSKEVLLFGLPGNPVAVMVTFMLFVRPALQALMGQSPTHLSTSHARCARALKKKPGRTEYLRGVLNTDENGVTHVNPVGNQGSGVLSSMVQAHCLIVLPPEVSSIPEGQWVQVMPFTGFLQA